MTGITLTDIRGYRCPYPGCDFEHATAAGPEESESALAGMFGPGVFAATARSSRLASVEATLNAHMGEHTPAQWAIAMKASADRITQLEQLATGILATFTRTDDGHRARVGQVQIGKWEAILRGDA